MLSSRKPEAVSEAMIYFAAIRALNHVVGDSTMNPASQNITCDAATVQNTKATSNDFEQQAAHLLPGQIKVAKSKIWEVAEDWTKSGDRRGIRLAAQAEEVFARTCILPAAFNRADSEAERETGDKGGLKSLFSTAVTELWRQSRCVVSSSPNDNLAIDRQAINSALTLWFSTINAIYERAARGKLEKYKIAKKANDKRGAERRQLEYRVLSEYARSFLVVSPMRFLEGNPALSTIISNYQQCY